MSDKTDKFIALIAPLVVAEYNKRDKWVLPSVCIAQSALETGWGTSTLMIKANAFFGIKANKSWNGKVYSSKTKECYDGVNFTTDTATFRAYDNLSDSISDYYDLITKSSRYAKAVNCTDATKAIEHIHKGGYATDPAYTEKIISIINGYGLTRYDTRQIESEEDKQVTIKEVIEAMKSNGYVLKTQTENELTFYKGTDTTTLKDGDIIKLKPNATYWNDKNIPSWILSKTLYYRGINKNGVIFSTLKTGAITGVINPNMII